MKARLFMNAPAELVEAAKRLTGQLVRERADATERAKRRGVRWCKRCSRVHGADGCKLVPVKVAMGDGRTRIHWVHPGNRGRMAFAHLGEDVA